MKKLSRINLNLLVVLDVLLQEKHVTRASKKLNVTQSTVSTALNQLRELFHDDLLIREKNYMVLTPKAQALAPKLRAVLNQLNILLNEKNFDPLTSEMTFKLAMDDILECLLLPELNNYISQQGIKVKSEIQHAAILTEQLFLGVNAIDLGIGALVSKAASFLRYEKLFDEHFVCVGRQGHPLLKKPLALGKYLTAGHLSLYSPAFYEQDPTNIKLAELGKTRHVVMNVTHVSTALYLLMNSDLIASVPLTLVNKAKPFLNLSYQELPFQIPDVPIYQVWHAQYDNDDAHIWLRNLIKTILLGRLKQP